MNTINFKQTTNKMITKKFTLHSTTDYSIFNIYKFNRKLNQKNLNNIEKSIKVKGQKQPLLVSPDGYVVDGQHRLEVLRKLNIPVWYVINHETKTDDIITVNTERKDLSLVDYVRYYAKRGDLTFKRLLQKIEEWKDDFPPIAIMDAYDTSVSRLRIKQGVYVINEILGNEVLAMCKMLNHIISRSTTSVFVCAMRKIVRKYPDFDIEHFYKNVQECRLNVYSRREEVCEEIIRVYNFRKKKGKLKI
jgi:hypothetical protein|tara:strand:- start:116 stop:856 length:741 start_codon:yes stop_codon:yes gene_type:complete